ncbi:acyl-CoA thioester hydrolase [Gracilimonas mengyeensis]|uniref:Acyl-CoA thioester hydrolase n=2 Tax=Gracilimonas mengyeensis TaxID=1302730 RepID=A0A521CBD1_9BACT|nr:acyl-CoA thioester hydrolase [Gracilimonas mengyeensis]
MKFPDKEPVVEFTHPMRSRYGETDRMGYVYYGRYLEYFEVARTEMIRSMGVSYRELEDSGVMLPVVHAEVDYKVPVLYDEEMFIKVMVFEVPSVRLRTYYEVTTAASDKVHAQGEVSLCFVDRESRRPCRAPESFIKSMQDGLKA